MVSNIYFRATAAVLALAVPTVNGVQVQSVLATQVIANPGGDVEKHIYTTTINRPNDTIEIEMIFLEWFVVAAFIHNASTTWGFSSSDDTKQLVAAFTALGDSYKEHCEDPQTVMEKRARLLTRWIMAFQVVAGNDDARWKFFRDSLEKAKIKNFKLWQFLRQSLSQKVKRKLLIN